MPTSSTLELISQKQTTKKLKLRELSFTINLNFYIKFRNEEMHLLGSMLSSAWVANLNEKSPLAFL